MPKPKIAMFPSPSGSAIWRLIDPAKYLRKHGYDVRIGINGIDDEIADWADIYVLQNIVDMKGLATLYAYKQKRGKKIISEWDDYIVPNEDNPYKKDHQIYKAFEVFQVTMRFSDALTVTNPYLKKLYSQYNKNIHVLPNYMDLDRWDLPKKKNESGLIRIGWAGSMTHSKDIEMIAAPLKKILKEFKNTQLILVGDNRLADIFEGYNVEAMVGVPFDYWPMKLNGLGLDIGVAPLVDNKFNRCKSNIKWQEYSIAQVPGIYSEIVYGQSTHHIHFDGTAGMTATNPEQWYRCLKNYIICENLRKDVTARAYSIVRSEYNLATNIKEWIKVYDSLTQ